MEDNMLAPCVNWQEKLAALHQDDLSPDDHEALNAHMAGCPGCKATFADYKKMDSKIREAFECESPLELPEWLTQEDLAKKLSLLPVPRLYQNLPSRFNHFLCRQAELTHVLEGLNSLHSLLVLRGGDGVGKTTLALEAAYQCLQGSNLMPHPLFDAVVWIAVSDRLDSRRWLGEILSTIALVLDYRSVAQLSFKEKRTKVNELLHTYQTLVIIDDFDTVGDRELLTWIQQIPEPSKVLITSRNAHQLCQAWTLSLDGLGENDALELIHHHVQKLELSVMESAEVNDLLHITHGNPQAIAMTLGNLKCGGWIGSTRSS
jgi:LuxR family glucitol operon transcriptional activator